MKHTSGAISVLFAWFACSASMTLGMAQANNSGIVFGSAQSYPTGGGIGQSVTADFNGDGLADLAAVSCNVSSCGAGVAAVYVMLGKGDGTLQAPVMYPTGSYEPMSVVVADLNGDGVPDLVVASQCASSSNCGNGQVSVFLGNGDGSFKTAAPYATGPGASYFVAAGDFNGDGNLDLAVVNQTSANSTVAIMLGNGDGTFQAPVAYTTGTTSGMSLAVGDFNGDGAADLAVANGSQDSISVLLGNGDGSFQFPALYASGGAFASAVAAGDVNGDGSADLIAVNNYATYQNLVPSASGSVGVLLGNGDGTFQTAVAYNSGGSQANFATLADFDGDGIVDIAVSNLGPSGGGNGAGVAGLLLGNGDGTFQPATAYGAGGSYTAALSAGDFNGDGQLDLAIVNNCPATGNCANGVVGMLLNTAAGFSRYATSTALSVTPNPANASQAVMLTATVNPGFRDGAISGTVTFYNAGTALDTVPVSSGQASYTASFAAVGPQDLQAVYSGGGSYASSASAVVSETVGTRMTLTSSSNPSSAGQAVTFTATLPATASGTVTFTDGSTTLGTGHLVNGVASLSSSQLAAGVHTITASYTDNKVQLGVAGLTQVVGQTSTTTLTASANPANTNQTVTYTAKVNAQNGAPATGTVAFQQGSPASTWGTAQLVNGQASITNAFGKAATYPLTAVYLGSAAAQSSSSATIQQVINAGTSIKTSVAIATSGSPSIINQPVTFTATITATSGTVPDGELVTFANGTNTIGTGATAGGVAMFVTSSLPVGQQSITAAYPGDGTYQSSTSRTLTQVVQLNPTTTTVSSSLNPATYGQSITFTATVAPQSSGGTPSGSVSFKSGSTTLGTATLSNGTGTLTTATLAAGVSTITATYGGDGDFAGSSGTAAQQISTSATTTTLNATPNPSSLNQTVTLTASVAGQYNGKLGGSVAFTQGSTVLGNAAPVGGKASITYAFTVVGTFPVIATYSGDSNDGGSVSAAVNQTVGNITTKTVLATSGSPAYVGQAVTFTATVTPTTGTVPDGESVTFYDGTASIGTGTTKGGAAALAISTLAVGTHSMTATYGGDSTYGTSTSKAVSQVISLNPSTTTLGASLNPSTYGQAVTFTAKVAPGSGSGTPTGTVTFKNGSAVIGSVGLVNGVAALTPSSLAAGSLSIAASYGGDGTFGSSSGALTQTVTEATTTTTLSATPNPSSLSQNVVFTATVTGVYAGKLTGSVSFLNGSKVLGSSTLANGKASFSYAFATSGTYSMTAVYGGDVNDQASTSAAVSQVVNNATTITTVTSSGSPAYVGQAVTFSAVVTSTYGAIPNGELVTFYDSSAAIGTANTNGGAATFTTSTLNAAVHSITATYAGDSSFQPSTSKIFKQTISADPTTSVVTSSANPAAYGAPVTFTATVSSAEATPSGTVTFKNGTAALGTASLNPQGVATLTTVTLAAGTYSITAAYSGSVSSAKSTSAAINQSVSVASTTTQVISSANPSAAGESVTFTAIVRSATAFATGSVTFTAGSSIIGTGTIVNGSAKISTTTLPIGASTITATYTGTSSIAGSSASLLQNVE